MESVWVGGEGGRPAETPTPVPPPSRRRARRRARGERGATLVEFALIAPLLFLLLAGIIDFGSVYNDYISVRQGVREGARQGIVANFGSSCTLNAFSSGQTPSANMQKLMCTVKNRIGINPNSTVYVKLLFDPVGASNYKANSGLIVCALTPANSLTGLSSPFLNGKVLKTKVEMNIETTSGSSEAEGEEAPPAGATWSWCTASGSTP